MVKASEFKNVCKAVNDRKLAELKKEIIEILKKQDEKDVKKAIDYFNSQEGHYTHLEKSLISGKWIQKAGYGVGTVRIWKGKKYKKIAPGKWARVFDKEGRGTNIAIGKLIARVQKIDNVEDLMAFVMQNKQRFVDENGIDLPVLDKLRAAVDAKNNGGMGSKTTSKPAEKTDEKYDKELVDSWKDDYKNFSADALKEKIEEYTKVLERAKNDNPSPDQRVAVKQNEHRLKALNELLEEKKNKPAEKKEDSSRNVEMAKEKIKQYAGKKINSNEISDIKILDDGERSGFLTYEFKSGNDKYKMTYDSGFGGEKGGVSIKKIESEESDKGLSKEDMKKLSDEVSDINTQKLYKKITQEEKDKKYDELYKKYFPIEPKIIKDEREKWLNRVDDEITDELKKSGEEQAKKMNDEFLMQKLEEFRNKKPTDIKASNDRDFKFWVLNHIAKRADRGSLEDAMDYFNIPYDAKTENYNKRNELALSILEKEAKRRGLNKEEPVESEAEKTQNRSEAMKGNQNAKKLFTSEDGAEDYFKTIVSPFEFNIGEAKVRMEIREKTNLPPDVSQIPFDLVVVRDNGSTVVSHPKSYDDAYDEILETIRGENSSLSTEWPDMNGKFVRLHNRYAMDSLKALPKEDKYGNKVDDFIDEEIKNKAGSFKKNTKELQNELMSLSKQRNENLDEIKRLNADLAKINQDKYNDEARGNPTEDYDKQIEELKKKMDNLQDEHADIEKRGNDIVKELDKLEKEEKKVIENNPKSVEGMDFVNKNKMHVLANFLANHDNVNMATAVIRLQAAYEKLGEEKFLAHFPKEIVERYRKEAGKEEPKKKSFTPISKDKMKSMSDDELKDYEAKLEKDLLATSRTDPDYVEKYNHWREVHGENNDRFHQAIEDEARAEKQAEADAKSAKEKEINEKYNGYFENRKGLDKARDLKTLEKKYNFDGKVMSSKEFVEQAMDNGVEIKEREVNKLDYPSRTRWNRMTGYEQDEYEKRIKAAGKKTVYSINGFEFPKTVVDYAKFYKEKGKSKSGNEKPSKSETAIKNKATSLAGAFGYSKTYAEKMGSPFNLELAEQTVDEELDWDEGSKKALKEELKRIYSEKKVQKSLFDDFVMDMFIDEDEEIEDAIKTDESLFNDYSAEQPELFNSTEMKVQEAFNRCGCCL